MSTFYDFTLKKLGGGELPLSQFEGRCVLVVNVASRCGLTPQYKGLEALYKEYKDQGLEVVGVPCNQFLEQEPGTDEEIRNFCDSKYGVSFPIAGKVEVNGSGRDPLYSFLAGDEAKFPGDIQWNFEKFLVDKNGEVLARFEPQTTPNDPKLVAAITQALAA